MILSKEKINSLIYKTIVMTSEACGRKMSMTNQAKLKNKIFKEFETQEKDKRGAK